MIAFSHGGTVGSQKSESVNDDQQSSILISKLQKLPSNASWSDKQVLLSGKITRLATTQTGSKYLQNLLTKSNPVLIEFLL